MKLVWPIAVVLIVASGLVGQAASAAPAPSQWEQPAASLAEQIAGILGPGQAHLAIRNLSTVPSEEIPAIRLALEQDLKAHGVLASGVESANSIRVTLSENLRERLWVAEVIEGSETRVAMVRVEPGAQRQTPAGGGITLRKQTVLTTGEAVLAALETADGLVAVEPEEIVIYGHTAAGWRERKRVAIGQARPLARDPRAVILPAAGGEGFEAYVAGMVCSGAYLPAQPTGDWSVHCRESDDPWPIVQGPAPQAPAAPTSADSPVSLKAFYNAARNYFTGIVTPSLNVDLPPFYSEAVLPRPASGAALLIGGIDGKVQILEGTSLKPVAGTRDWGSDFAVLNSGCGAGAQILVSGSGEAASDSLRAFELPAQEAVPASAPLAMDGTVTALWTAPDGKSVFAVVRGAADQYEVERVTASCNE
ncbi:MAG: hypothetical protein ABSD43_08870 [Terracidiphilus sp.]|jgi:hypothetical protein